MNFPSFLQRILSTNDSERKGAEDFLDKNAVEQGFAIGLMNTSFQQQVPVEIRQI